MAKANKTSGRLSIADMKKLVNKSAGANVAFSLKDENPTEVNEFIPTGSKWLDGIVRRGKWGGIPVSKISEIAGLEATGKSYMAAQVAANAQKMGIDVIYFDSESAIDPQFLENAGCDLENLLYVQAQSVEFVLETIENLLANSDGKMLFIWDSMAMTPSVSDIESDFNPLSTMAVKPRILSKGMAKLVQPIGVRPWLTPIRSVYGSQRGKERQVSSMTIRAFALEPKLGQRSKKAALGLREENVLLRFFGAAIKFTLWTGKAGLKQLSLQSI